MKSNFMRLSAMVIIGFLSALCIATAPGQATSQEEKAGKKSKKKSEGGKSSKAEEQSAAGMTTSIPFGETNNGKPFNASGVVEIGDGQFLFCDNKNRNELLELRLDAQGKKVGSIMRRPLTGIDTSQIEDLEGMTMVELGGERFIVATSSFNRHSTQKGNRMMPAEGYAGGLLRIRMGTDNTLTAENIPGFREWLVSKYPELQASAHLVSDSGGLNIEGLAWDPNRGALLFGLRTPLINGKPVILPIRLKGGAWRLEDMEPLPAITLQGDSAGYQGIRSIAYAPARKFFVISLGKAISGMKTPFLLYVWDGGEAGALRRLNNLQFARGVKVEGLARGTIGGKTALLLIDDAGGYQIIAEDDPRLR